MESYPTKIFEYMALGLPVISSNFDLYRKVVEESGSGLCVAPDDAEALANALRRLMLDPELVRTLGENAMRTVHERYDWRSQGEELVRFYRRIIRPASEVSDPRRHRHAKR